MLLTTGVNSDRDSSVTSIPSSKESSPSPSLNYNNNHVRRKLSVRKVYDRVQKYLTSSGNHLPN